MKKIDLCVKKSIRFSLKRIKKKGLFFYLLINFEAVDSICHKEIQEILKYQAKFYFFLNKDTVMLCFFYTIFYTLITIVEINLITYNIVKDHLRSFKEV